MPVSLSRLLFLPAILLLLTACENDPKEVNALSRKTREVEEARDIKGLFSQSANMKASLSSPLMYRVRDDTTYTEFPKTLHVDFYNEAQAVESVVTANYGKYYDLLNKVYLRDSVVVYKITGDTLYCEDLWWDQNSNVFYTDRPVRIRTPERRLNGSGLWALANFTKYTIKDPVGLVDIPEQVQ